MAVYFGNKCVQIFNQSIGSAEQWSPPYIQELIDRSKTKYEHTKCVVDYGKQLMTQLFGPTEYAFIGIRRSAESAGNEIFTLSQDMYKIVTSDGHIYEYAFDGTTVTHQWDPSGCVQIDGEDFQYVIYYCSAGEYWHDARSVLDCSKNINVVYVINMNIKYNQSSSGLCKQQIGLEGLEFVNGHYLTWAANQQQLFAGCLALSYIPENVVIPATVAGNQLFSSCHTLYKIPDSWSNIAFSGSCFNIMGQVAGIEYLPETWDFTNVTSLQGAFNGMSALKKIPDSIGNCIKCESVTQFCQDCVSLTNIPYINTEKCTSFENFCRNTSLTSLPVLNTSNATNLKYFCAQTPYLTKIPLLDVSKCTSAGGFLSDSGLTSLPALNFANATDASNICNGCKSLSRIDDGFQIGPKCTATSGLFSGCVSLTRFPAGMGCSKSTTFQNFCSGDKSLEHIPSGLSTSSAQVFDGFLRACPQLRTIDSVIDLTNMKQQYTLFLDSQRIRDVKIILPIRASVQMNSPTTLSIPSLRFLADNAPTITSILTVSIGSTNINNANAADPTIIQTLQAKGWTVN